MSSLKALNQAMDYLEEHLCEEIDWQKLGKIAGCSGGLFPRIFSLLVGIPLSEFSAFLSDLFFFQYSRRGQDEHEI